MLKKLSAIIFVYTMVLISAANAKNPDQIDTRDADRAPSAKI